MHHFNDAAQEAADELADQREAEYELLWPQVEAELKLEAIESFGTGAPVTFYSETMQAESTEDVDLAFIDFVDSRKTSRLRDMVKALHAAAEGKPEARLQAMALIAAFAQDRAEQFTDSVTRARMAEAV